MPTLIHQRVELARKGENPTVIRRLPSGWVVLGDNQTIPGYTLLLSDPVVTDLNELPLAGRASFMRDMALVGDALLQATDAYLINYSILGNTDHALHAHIHPRYRDEPEEKRRTGYWAYFPPHAQVPFGSDRHRPLMERIGTALDELCDRHHVALAGASEATPPLFENVDCLMFNVADLAAGLGFYRDKLGLPLVWKTPKGAGLRVGESELVINEGSPRSTETDIKVACAEETARRFVEAGGRIVAGPFDIQIGKCVVVADPWENQLVLLDSTKGLLKTDAAGNVIA